MMPTTSRFTQITFLHDRDELPDGAVAQLEAVLRRHYPHLTYARPYVPDVESDQALKILRLYVQRIEAKSLLVGMGRGGLLACALQTLFPALNLSVFAVNAPTEDGTVSALPCPRPHLPNYANRVALYSSAYEPIAGRCDWSAGAPVAYDVTWLASGKNHFSAISYVISAYLQGLNMTKAVSMLFPPSV